MSGNPVLNNNRFTTIAHTVPSEGVMTVEGALKKASILFGALLVGMLLMFLAFVGATAGSTGGGLKVIRFLILAKAAWRGVRRFARPRAVYPVRLSGETLDESKVASVVGYCGMWVLLFLGGTLALSGLQGLEPTSAATSVLATLNNIGPGLNMVGPAENFGFFGDASKLLLSMFMILGRLELYAILVLLSPRFWKQ